MKKLAIVSDSFKGSISSSEICCIVTQETLKVFPQCEIISIPVADGGEGTVDSFLQCLDGEKVWLEATGPLFEHRKAYYGRFDETAVIEMATIAGLPLVENRKDPMRTTTYGVGELVLHALERGVKRVIFALGGSATNDGGCGCAAALGTKFYDAEGNTFIPTGGTLAKIHRIDNEETARRLADVEVIAMCDIDNPMCGPNGAAYVFAPQKGADEEMVRFLDAQLESLNEAMITSLDKHVADVPGSGAAGAMGAGAVAFFGAKLQSGIETVLNTVHFEERVEGADLIITGEGKLDAQSLQGKVVSGVAQRAKALNIPAIAIVGDICDHIEAVYQMGISAVFSTNRLAITFSEAKPRSKRDYTDTLSNLMRLIRVLTDCKEVAEK